jgi:hypothetical protein
MLVNKTNIGFGDSQRILNVREEYQHGQNFMTHPTLFLVVMSGLISCGQRVT